ncbi:MAG: dipeptide ABC transporter ATP-binding protein [Azospirillaceae bacterium]
MSPIDRPDRASTRQGRLLAVTDLVKHFQIRSRRLFGKSKTVRAVDGVSFELDWGETLGIVGESGCGKSTLARTLLRLETPDGGSCIFDGSDLFGPAPERSLRRRIQVVFQDPFAALNPRMTVYEALTEPLRLHPGTLPREKWPERVRDLLGRVGLRPEFAQRYPHEFSGGQLQRIGIARALVLGPDLIVLDEPVSALDVSIQAQVVNLLEEVQEEFGVAYICISHDLSIVRHIADRVAVMYLGNFVEIGGCEDIYASPGHPYTKALLSAETRIATGRTRRRRILLEGEVPSPIQPPSGCRFRTRCWLATDKCREVPPPVRNPKTGQVVRCHFPLWDSG